MAIGQYKEIACLVPYNDQSTPSGTQRIMKMILGDTDGIGQNEPRVALFRASAAIPTIAGSVSAAGIRRTRTTS